MNKFFSFLITLILCIIAVACSQTPESASKEMIKEIDAAAQAGSLEQFDAVYKKYYEYFQTLSPEEQLEFLRLTIKEEPSETVQNFVLANMEEIINLEYLKKMGDLAEQVYIRDKVNQEKNATATSEGESKPTDTVEQ